MRPEAETYKHYLLDLGLLLKEDALEAKAQLEHYRGTKDEAYFAGGLLTYYRIISLMQQQAGAFGIPLEDLHLADIRPDRDLL